MNIPAELIRLLSKAPSFNLGIEAFEFFPLERLAAAQVGYACDARSGKPSDSWLANWLVIASSCAHPLIYDLASGGILFDRTGQGGWSPSPIFANLHEMLSCFEQLQHYVTTTADFYQDDFAIAPVHLEVMQQIIYQHTNESFAENAVRRFEFADYG